MRGKKSSISLERMKTLLKVAIILFSLPIFADQAPRVPLSQAQKVLGAYRPSMLLLEADTETVFDETLNFQPGLNLYNEAQTLTDLFGTKGSQLCAPISITHGMTYLRYPAGFSRLRSVGDVDQDGVLDSYRDKIRHFFAVCNTDREIGTRYRQTVACMREYIVESGYKAWVYMIGPHAVEAPEGSPLESVQHVLQVDDVRATVGRGFLVLMGIGWYKWDAASETWVREGGHFFNLYGYDWMQAWGNDKMRLHVVNSWVNYDGRATTAMFDTISMTKIPPEKGIPYETAFELKGTGFDFTTHRAFVEDIFPAVPLL